MFTRLLLAIDDSPGSEVATDFAVAIAQHHAAEVHVFHVNEYLVGGRGVTLLTRAEAAELVTGAVHRLRAAGVRATGTSVVASYRDVARRIAGAAHDRSVDAIVLGSQRHRRLGRIFSPGCARAPCGSPPCPSSPRPRRSTSAVRPCAWTTACWRNPTVRRGFPHPGSSASGSSVGTSSTSPAT